MCNLYNQTTAKEAMRRLMNFTQDLTGNIEPGEVYPDRMAPIIRNGAGGRDLAMARWGMPTPPQFLAGRKTDRGITNIRNTASPHWRRWLGVEHRCLVPFTAFAEPDTAKGGNAWFTLRDDRPAFFAGLHVRGWTSVRKLKDGATTDDLFGFLTTEPNALVAANHPKAMPVILTEPEDWETWLTAPWTAAARLQRPLADDVLELQAPDR
ncbi:MAG TPA: SOS response-associated peptidase family protein [Albidovulum sp.]|uniref:SOS response-associated peptidase n=1 Tax=Albidovulum sp. TaxID=1872424 RepID=UPI002BB2E1C0|nr:SOS response-associated peptidase family protein [Albidovulum sp.]